MVNWDAFVVDNLNLLQESAKNRKIGIFENLTFSEKMSERFLERQHMELKKEVRIFILTLWAAEHEADSLGEGKGSFAPKGPTPPNRD